MSKSKPLWANRQMVRRLYGVPEHRLDDLVHSGLVRSCKFAHSQQASRLFCVEDVERVLHDLAEGREPTRPPATRYRPTRHPTRRAVRPASGGGVADEGGRTP